MKVASECNKKTYQQHRPNAGHKGKGFADMYKEMAAKKPGKPEAEKGCCCCCETNHTSIAMLSLRINGFRSCCGTQIKLTAEQLAVVEEYRTVKFGKLEVQHAEELPELIISKAPDPKYPKSIYDIPASELEAEFFAARSACSYIDTEGMTKAEIYSRIESIYKDYLGKDFMEPQIFFNGTLTGYESYDKSPVRGLNEFESQLKRFGINPWDSESLIEAKGYTGMSKSEMRAAVREQYPKNMTLKDCIMMSYEFGKLGLEEINYGSAIMDRIFSTMGGRSPQTQKVFNAMLQMPAGFDAMKASYDAFAKDNYTSYPTRNMTNVFSKLLSWVGGSGSPTQGLTGIIRGMLDKLEASGDLSFDEYGYCRVKQSF